MNIDHNTNPSIVPFLQEHIKSAWKDIVLHGRYSKIKIRKEVYDSWRRCIDIGLDPLNPPSPPILKKHQLQKTASGKCRPYPNFKTNPANDCNIC